MHSRRAAREATPRQAGRRERPRQSVGNFRPRPPVNSTGICNRKYIGGEEDRLMSEVQSKKTLSREFSTPAEEDRLARTAAALEANGITVLRALNSAESKRMVLDL